MSCLRWLAEGVQTGWLKASQASALNFTKLLQLSVPRLQPLRRAGGKTRQLGQLAHLGLSVFEARVLQPDFKGHGSPHGSWRPLWVWVSYTPGH